MKTEICVLCPYGIDPGLVSKASALAPGAVRVVIPPRDAEKAARYGANLIHTVEDLPPDEGQVALWLKEKILNWGSTVVLAPATVFMRNVIPRLAHHLKVGLTADCTQLQLEGEKLIQTRPAFGNSLMATIRTCSSIQMATVRTGVFPPEEKKILNPTVLREAFHLSEGSVTLRALLRDTEGAPLSQGSIVVAGGVGIGSREGFQKLERLANQWGGALAATRGAVDAGFAPYACQVGMTGVTVCPKVYVAVGISGAVQHLAGMSGSEKVIAVNSDPKAPIFDYADLGIVADWETVIDQLLEE